MGQHGASSGRWRRAKVAALNIDAASMRAAYQEQLDGLTRELARICTLVAAALDGATRALSERDLQLAEQVITRHDAVETARATAEQQAFGLLASQAPVATDPRIVVSAVHGAGDIEWMGGLASHVARTVRRRHPQPALPEDSWNTSRRRAGSGWRSRSEEARSSAAVTWPLPRS